MPSSKQITADFILQMDKGYVLPADMAAACYAMHACLVDKYPEINLWLMPEQELEQVGDALTKAIRSAEVSEQDHPEAETA